MKKFEKPELTVEELSKALYEANIKLKEQEKNRLEFYSNISHDLRSPITAISNSLEYLLSNPEISKDEITETLLVMSKRADYMAHLINDIFLLSSLDSSDDKVHKEPVDMDFFLEDYFYMCDADPHYEKVTFKLDIPKPLSLSLDIDPVLMHRVLDNLITNSIKYSKAPPQITLGAYISEDKSSLIIYESDNGIGISPKHLPHIFERSYMVKKSRTPGDGSGSGFGLAIVKSIVEHHNGTITCTSEPNIGSRFEIKIKIYI